MKKSAHLLLELVAGAAIGAGIYAFYQSEERKDWLNKMKEKAAAATQGLADLAEMAKEKMEETTDRQEA